MKEKCRMPCNFMFLFLFAVCAVNGKNVTDRAHRLNRDIVLLNLVNGLHLTQEQTESLIECNKRADTIRKDYQKQLKKKEHTAENILSDVRQILLRNEEIPDNLKKDVYQMKKQQHDLEDERRKKLLQIEKEITNLLTSNQLIVIDSYKPCTIPPAAGKIGQSAETVVKGASRFLSRIREMPEDRYHAIKDFFIDMHMDKIEHHMNTMNENTREQYRDNVLNIFRRARNLSEQEFMIQTNDLAKSLIPDQPIKHHRRENELGKVGHFLLDFAIVPLLKTRSK